ncbi:MAG: hypothetical protein GF334_00790 [Candidatus Altiarchaeales archaeon]|nr:hypothetical protein [Candidatus Altiarchaeales archaeon]
MPNPYRANRTYLAISPEANRAGKALALMKNQSLSQLVEELLWKEAEERGIAGEFKKEKEDENTT